MSVVIQSGLIVMAAICMEGITGFGAAVLAIPFLSILLGVRIAVPLMSSMSLLLSGIMFLWQRHFINKRVLRLVVIFAGIGFLAGTLIYDLVPEKILKLILGGFVFSSAAVSLVKMIIGREEEPVDETPTVWRIVIDRAVVFLGGVCHGAMGTGGPMIVVYTSRVLRDKSEFRATMVTIWLVFNTLVLARTILRGGVINAEYGKLLLGVLPFFSLGALAGNKLHLKVQMRTFRYVMYGLLLFSGGSLIVVSLPL